MYMYVCTQMYMWEVYTFHVQSHSTLLAECHIRVFTHASIQLACWVFACSPHTQTALSPGNKVISLSHCVIGWSVLRVTETGWPIGHCVHASCTAWTIEYLCTYLRLQSNACYTCVNFLSVTQSHIVQCLPAFIAISDRLIGCLHNWAVHLYLHCTYTGESRHAVVELCGLGDIRHVMSVNREMNLWNENVTFMYCTSK